jgi:hypothetical protein
MMYEALKRLAAASHRSVQEYVRALIEREVRLARPSPVEAARQWRGKLAGRTVGDTVEDVRADRPDLKKQMDDLELNAIADQRLSDGKPLVRVAPDAL